MSRPTKEGLEYFPLDTDIDEDDKMYLVEATYGIEGFAIIIKLLMTIYKNGYYYRWTEREQLIFSRKKNVDINTLKNVVNDSVKWGLFSEDIFKKYHILTSKGIQKRYLVACKRRKEVEIIRSLCLVNEVVSYDNVILIDDNSFPSYNNSQTTTVSTYNNTQERGINVNNNPQSKVKESKVKESKVTYAPAVNMFSEEYQKLVEKYGEEITHKAIEKLSAYKMATGKRYKSDYHAILSWVIEEVAGKPKEYIKKKEVPKCPKCGKTLKNEIANHADICYSCGADITGIKTSKKMLVKTPP